MSLASRLLTKVIPTAAVGTIAFTLTTETAYGFFPPIPTGGDVITVSPPPAPITPVNPTIPVIPPAVPPTVPPFVPPPVVPPVSPPPFVPPPTVPVTVPITVPPTVPPSHVPEPMTLLTGLIGLSTIAGAGIARRKKKPTA